jgi:predicted dithiol-disulfide oxidoreductase (DUF899 family)
VTWRATCSDRNHKIDGDWCDEQHHGSREWIAERKALLAKEKEFNRLRDELSARRRDLP